MTAAPEFDADGFCTRCNEQRPWCRCPRPSPAREERRARELHAVAADPVPPPPPEPPPEDDVQAETQRPALEFSTLAELAARVDGRGPRRWLLRGLWPTGDYGVHAAEAKAQKTWNTVDLAVSVASGTPWLGAVAVDAPGPVLMFVGEGGEANTVRRARALAEARDVVAEDLPVVVCTRAPHLSDRGHLGLVAEQLERTRPVLVTLDPLYLAARGADLRDLYAMGAMLEEAQRLCQHAGAALFVVTHHNRGAGRGAGRITGAGPAEWGRVLVSASVISRRTDPDSRATDVVTELDVIGGEVPDRTLRVRRRIWADDPDDLDTALHVLTEVTEGEPPGADQGGGAAAGGRRMSPAERKVLQALQGATKPLTVQQIGDAIAAVHGTSLRRPTISTHLNALARAGSAVAVDDTEGLFPGRVWALVGADTGQSTAADTAPPLTSVSTPSALTSVTVSAGVSAPTGRADTADTPDTWRVSGQPIAEEDQDR